MKNRCVVLLVSIFLVVITLSGCAGKEDILDKVKFWQKNTKTSEKAQQDTRQDEQEEVSGRGQTDKNFSTSSAGLDIDSSVEDRRIYDPENYTEIVSSIKNEVLDRYLESVLDNQGTKSGSSPYLTGLEIENRSVNEKKNNLEKRIREVNPVEWKIVGITPRQEDLVLLSVKYFFPGGRTKVAEQFVVERNGGEWFIDFSSFYDSFQRVGQFAEAGKESSSREH